MLRLFQQVETVLVTLKVLEADLIILPTRLQLFICTTIFDTKTEKPKKRQY